MVLIPALSQLVTQVTSHFWAFASLLDSVEMKYVPSALEVPQCPMQHCALSVWNWHVDLTPPSGAASLQAGCVFPLRMSCLSVLPFLLSCILPAVVFSGYLPYVPAFPQLVTSPLCTPSSPASFQPSQPFCFPTRAAPRFVSYTESLHHEHVHSVTISILWLLRPSVSEPVPSILLASHCPHGLCLIIIDTIFLLL